MAASSKQGTVRIAVIGGGNMGRNHVRTVRRDANDRLKKLLKDHQISEDDEKRALADVQKATDEHIKAIDDLQNKKDAELLGR